MSYAEEAFRHLFDYCPPLTKRADFDTFWIETLAQAGRVPLNPVIEEYEYPGCLAKVYRIAYNGFDQTVIRGWYIVPRYGTGEKMPCLIHYHGGGGNKGQPWQYMHWISMGIAVLAVDCRDQSGESGESGNGAVYSDDTMQNLISKSLLNHYEYYTRALYMDNLKAIDFACTRGEIDRERIIIEGASQGGAIGMTVCALDSRPWLALVDIPSNSNIEKRVETQAGIYACVTKHLQIHPNLTDRVFETLSYFDTMNMADKIRCRVFASVGLKDKIAPALFYFATYNRIIAEKTVKIYPFNSHEVSALHTEEKMRFLQSLLK